MSTPSVTDSADFGARLMRQSLDQARQVPTTPLPHGLTDFGMYARISLKAEKIAELLSDVAHIEVGLEPQPFANLIQPTRERFRMLAERAIQSIDPNHYDETRDKAVEETLDWLNGPPEPGLFANAPSHEDIARYAVSAFLARESRPVIRKQPALPVYAYVGPCRICSGDLERDEQGVSACNSCGRIDESGGAR